MSYLDKITGSEFFGEEARLRDAVLDEWLIGEFEDWNFGNCLAVTEMPWGAGFSKFKGFEAGERGWLDNSLIAMNYSNRDYTLSKKN